MLFTLIALFIGGLAAYAHHLWKKRAAWKLVLEANIAKRQAEREETIVAAETCALKLDQARREQIGALNFNQLRDELQKGSISCLEAVQTYYWKGVEAHRKTNSVTMFMKEAEQWAKEWDSKAKESAFVKPTLFGIPISVKECINVKGYDVTRGFAQDCFKPQEEDSILVNHLKKLGAIPFCLTNVPQSVLTFNCANYVYGITNHPMDRNRTPGGSTGGEAALIGAGGSILGVGGDVGGSIRVPSHFSGIFGLKPSHMRFGHRGSPGAVPGRPFINANDGPMSQDVDASVEFCRAVWSTTHEHDADPYAAPVLWNEKVFSSEKPLRIGYYVDDGWFTPTPACQRAVLEAKRHLEAAGHTLVPFAPPRIPEMFQMYVRALAVDGGRFVRDKLLNDIIHPTLYPQIPLFFVPVFIQRLLTYPAKLLFPRLANVLPAMTTNTVELRQTYAKIEEYRGDYVVAMKKQHLDAILSPPQVLVAPTHDIPCKLFSTATYTCVYNLLDFAAGVVPVTKVTEEDDQRLENYPTADPWYKLVKKTSKGSVGFPVGAQIAAPPFREETVLRILKQLEEAVRKE